MGLLGWGHRARCSQRRCASTLYWRRCNVRRLSVSTASWTFNCFEAASAKIRMQGSHCATDAKSPDIKDQLSWTVSGLSSAQFSVSTRHRRTLPEIGHAADHSVPTRAWGSNHWPVGSIWKRHGDIGLSSSLHEQRGPGSSIWKQGQLLAGHLAYSRKSSEGGDHVWPSWEDTLHPFGGDRLLAQSIGTSNTAPQDSAVLCLRPLRLLQAWIEHSFRFGFLHEDCEQAEVRCWKHGSLAVSSVTGKSTFSSSYSTTMPGTQVLNSVSVFLRNFQGPDARNLIDSHSTSLLSTIGLMLIFLLWIETQHTFYGLQLHIHFNRRSSRLSNRAGPTAAPVPPRSCWTRRSWRCAWSSWRAAFRPRAALRPRAGPLKRAWRLAGCRGSDLGRSRWNSWCWMIWMYWVVTLLFCSAGWVERFLFFQGDNMEKWIEEVESFL